MFKNLSRRFWTAVKGVRQKGPPLESVIRKVTESEFIELAKAAEFSAEKIHDMVNESYFKAVAFQIGEDWLQIVGNHK